MAKGQRPNGQCYRLFREASPGDLDIIQSLVRENLDRLGYSLDDARLSDTTATYTVRLIAASPQWLTWACREIEALRDLAKLLERALAISGALNPSGQSIPQG